MNKIMTYTDDNPLTQKIRLDNLQGPMFHCL